ncbi:TIR domain-containing protein [bacterium]|nr:TIR domain-containing protein [bacterium]
MSEVFISYAHEDEAHARRLAETLAAAGVEVWWDRKLVSGDPFDSKIGEALEAAGCVVVLWSRHALASRYVALEAGEAFDADKLTQARLDQSRPPFPFRRLNWVDASDDASWATLVESVSARLGRGVTPARSRGGEAARSARTRTMSLAGVSLSASLLTWLPLLAAAIALGLGAAGVVETATIEPVLWGAAGAGAAGFLMTLQNAVAFARSQGG